MCVLYCAREAVYWSYTRVYSDRTFAVDFSFSFFFVGFFFTFFALIPSLFVSFSTSSEFFCKLNMHKYWVRMYEAKSMYKHLHWIRRFCISLFPLSLRVFPPVFFLWISNSFVWSFFNRFKYGLCLLDVILRAHFHHLHIAFCEIVCILDVDIFSAKTATTTTTVSYNFQLDHAPEFLDSHFELKKKSSSNSNNSDDQQMEILKYRNGMER